MTRSEAREIMMQTVYEMDASGEMEIARATQLCNDKLAGNHKERGCRLMENLTVNLEYIDGLINDHSTRWKTSRMPKVDLAIMRVALAEMLYDEDIPDAVAVNEAVKIAKKYSTEQSAGFIHGVLGAISAGREKS